MEKWADCLISKVRCDSEDSHIEKVEVHKVEGDKVGPAFESSRQEVIENIEGGKTYITIYKGEKGRYIEGAKVNVILVAETKYIRTDRNKIESDNLGDLPRF